MGNGRAALGAEETPHRFSGRALALPLLHGAIDGELVFGNNGDEGWSLLAICRVRIMGEGEGEEVTVGAAALTLAVVAVVVAGDERGFDVGGVGDGVAEAVSGERHNGGSGWSECYKRMLVWELENGSLSRRGVWRG